MTKPFEKLFVQKGLYDGTKVLVDRELTDKEKKTVNDTVREEMAKFPHQKIIALVGEDAKGKIHCELVHKTRPARTKQDQLDDLIKSEKSKLKKR